MSGSGPAFAEPYRYQSVLPSLLRTADPTAVTLVNKFNYNACLIFVSATASSLTPSVVFNIDVWNKVANSFVEVLDSAAVTGISENVYQLGAKAESADISSTFPPTERIRIRPVHGDTDPLTYSVTVYWYRA